MVFIDVRSNEEGVLTISFEDDGLLRDLADLIADELESRRFGGVTRPRFVENEDEVE